MLQLTADHKDSKLFLTDFHWTVPYIVEKALPKNKHTVRPIGTVKTQVRHCTRLRPSKLKEPLPDVQTASQNWELDPEVIIRQVDLYARLWEFDFVELSSDNDYLAHVI